MSKILINLFSVVILFQTTLGISSTTSMSSLRVNPPTMRPSSQIPGFSMAISQATHIPAYKLWPRRYSRPETQPTTNSKYYLEGVPTVSINELDFE